MQLVRDLIALINSTWVEWGDLRLERLLYSQQTTARQVLLALFGLSAIFMIIRSFGNRNPGNHRMALPALVKTSGLSFFIISLADPRTALTRSETTFPGRRIALLIDASSSMLSALPSTTLAKGAPNNAAFFTTVGAARYFIERRMAGKYRDLMGLIEFGDDAYVITPFTTDYENILLSTALIGDWNEFMAFPDQGTVIARAVEQSVSMFKSFKYLDAAGNLMVLFSDGADAEVLESGKTAMDVVNDARKAKIPIYFVKVGREIPGRVQIGDEIWRQAVEHTGGKFYGGADEASIDKALRDIDRASAGRIEYKQYSTERPRFTPFA